MPWVDGVWKVPKKGKGKGKNNNPAALLAKAFTQLGNAFQGGTNGGKGGSKDAKQGMQLKPGQWLCKNHICERAIKRIPNAAGTKRCGNTKCCLLKSEAMNPPHDQRVAPAAPSYSVKTAQANATAAAAKEMSAAMAREKAEAAKEITAAAPGNIADATAMYLETAAAELRTPNKITCADISF